MYIHITKKERGVIAQLLARGRSHSAIAKELGVHKSTISREVERNRDSDGIYRAKVAQKKAKNRRVGLREHKKTIENNQELYAYVVSSLEYRWSPEQISGRIRKDGKIAYVSTVTIYAFMNRERPDLKQYRRHKRHRKHSLIQPKQALKRMIDTRPKITAKRKRIGDWEGDTIVGKEKTERILTHVDRKSGLLVAKRTKADSDSVRKQVKRIFKHLPCKTITYDNGSEFAAHKLIEQDTKSKVYFAYPGRPDQRGVNENTNGLLRQFFPKGISFATITQRDVDEAVAMINNRPRKRLGYCTSLEVFMKERGVAPHALV